MGYLLFFIVVYGGVNNNYSVIIVEYTRKRISLRNIGLLFFKGKRQN